MSDYLESTSEVLGDYMLKGWTLTDSVCSTCRTTPLMREPRSEATAGGRSEAERIEFCARCQGGPGRPISSSAATPRTGVDITTQPRKQYGVDGHLVNGYACAEEEENVPAEPEPTPVPQANESQPRATSSATASTASPDIASTRISQRLLQGYSLLGESCTNVTCRGIPLMGWPRRALPASGEVRKECVMCKRVYGRDGEIISSPEQSPPAAGEAVASSTPAQPAVLASPSTSTDREAQRWALYNQAAATTPSAPAAQPQTPAPAQIAGSSSRIDPLEEDAKDPLAWARGEFEIPSKADMGGEDDGDEPVYLCGNSLGLLPKRARALMRQELDVWSKRAVVGHFDHPHNRPWKSIDDSVLSGLAKVVGAKETEVAHSSTLTSNIHSLFISFYRPTARRWKIVIEKGAFPSDWYAVHSHPQIHEGVLSQEQIDSAIVTIGPREGEDCLRTEDILKVIEEHGQQIAVVWLGGVQYYTGQFFDVEPICEKAHAVSAFFGLDLAHAVGNVPLSLSAWKVDFAAWCTYKYLNAGPGAVAGYYIREGVDDGGRRLAGWWGQNRATRFQMNSEFDPIPGAGGYQHSNPPILSTIPLIASLQVLDRAGGMQALRAKSLKLTQYLYDELAASRWFTTESSSSSLGFRILTPKDPAQRGCQLSVMIMPPGSGNMAKVFGKMVREGVVGDERHPDVIRLSPVPLYNRFEDVKKAVTALELAMNEVSKGL